jgi:sugar/nucleoside kinase (ribokinase family)
MKSIDAYLFGMTVLSSIHKLDGPYPEADSYREIARSFLCPGGETMNAAMLLSGLGLSTALGGPHWGNETKEVLSRYAKQYAIDIAGIAIDDGYPGVRDIVLVDGHHRTVFGYFGRYFTDSVKRWNEPDAAVIGSASVAAIDPYFGDSSVSAARLCFENEKPYITIDTEYDGYLHEHAAATVIAREYRNQKYEGVSDAELFARYQERAHGLVVFTAGKNEIVFARRGDAPANFTPYLVEVESTLGAGDTFRAGIVYGIFRGWSDYETIRFASALAAVVCTKIPIADNVPRLDNVIDFIKRRN